MRTRLLVLLLAMVATLLCGCGVYSKVPPVNPEQDQWEGPLLDEDTMQTVHISVKPTHHTVVLDLSQLDADLSLLLGYLAHDTVESIDAHTITITEEGNYVLVIHKETEQ